MRVQIRYGVDIEDVPKETARLLHKAQQTLYKTDKPLMECVRVLEKDKEIDFFEAEGYISEIRAALAKADMVLGDSFAILAGYQQTKLNQVVPPQEDEQENAGEVSDDTEI